MKKKLLSLICILFITGCFNKNSHIETIIIEDNNHHISINYPITNTNIDINIENDIKNIYKQYRNEKYIELNIDYLLYKFDNKLSVTLFIYINDNNNIISYVKTYLYDNRIIKLNEFINRKVLNSLLINEIKNYNLSLDDINSDLEFSVDSNDLTLYFNKKNNYIEVKIPLEKLNIFIKNEKKVINEAVINEKYIDYNDKVIALTFDDGPSIYTESIVEYLYEQDCPSTFFILGNKVKDYSDLIKKSISYGMEIGNHSYNHKWLIKLKENEIKEQIEKTQNLIKEYTGYIPKIMRPTYGSVNKVLKESTNLDIILWNVDTMDWKSKNINKIVNRATKNLRDGNIILMHDIYKRTFNSIKKIVPIIKEKGYKCVTISELNEIKKLRNIYD